MDKFRKRKWLKAHSGNDIILPDALLFKLGHKRAMDLMLLAPKLGKSLTFTLPVSMQGSGAGKTWTLFGQFVQRLDRKK